MLLQVEYLACEEDAGSESCGAESVHCHGERSHAVGKAMTLGIILLLLGYGLLVEDAAWWKIGLAIAFQLATIPVASHLFCLVAYRKRVKRWSAGGWTRD